MDFFFFCGEKEDSIHARQQTNIFFDRFKKQNPKLTCGIDIDVQLVNNWAVNRVNNSNNLNMTPDTECLKITKQN